jgi:translation initiation factor 2B subunit (eIF-2B alpha/beta/delta family)
MTGVSILWIAARHWRAIAIAAMAAALGIQTARLRSAIRHQAALGAEMAALESRNLDLKSASDQCNERVEAMRREGEKMKARMEEAARRADAIAAAGVQAAADTLAHPPSNDCESILRYGREEAARFRW